MMRRNPSPCRTYGRFALRTLLAVAALCAAWPASAAAVEGQVFDDNARPLGGVVLHLVHEEQGPLGGLAGAGETRVVATTRTARDGFFRLEVALGEKPDGRYFVQTVAEDWDGLRYELPPPIEVSESLISSGQALANVLVRDARGWRELAHEIRRAGGVRSERGRILRSHGLPTQTLGSTAGTVVWTYPHVSYVFRNGELVETREQSARVGGETARSES